MRGPKSTTPVKARREELKFSKPPTKKIQAEENDKFGGWESDDDLQDEGVGMIKDFRNLNINQAGSSDKEEPDNEDDDDDGINPDEVVAKGPTRNKENVKENAKALTAPYLNSQRSVSSYNTFSGGCVISDINSTFVPNIEYIPQSVVDHSVGGVESNSSIEETIKREMSSKEICEIQDLIFSNNLSPPTNVEVNSSVTEPIDYNITSPNDSGYISMSPNDFSSVCSPYTNMSTPKHDTHENTYIFDNSSIPSPTKVTSWLDTTQECSQGSVENTFITYQQTSQPLQKIQNDKVLLDGITWSMPESELPPYHTFEISKPRKSEPHIQYLIPVEQSSTFKISSPESPKIYIQLSTPKERKLLNIRPNGTTVSEIDLDKSGAVRLREMCIPLQVEVANKKVALETEREVISVNERIQTKLIQSLQEKVGKQFLEGIYTRVKRMIRENRHKLLLQRDITGKTALYYSALQHKEHSVIARFIAEGYIELNQNPDEVFGTEDNSLLHIIARSGDMYAQVLAELLRVKYPDGKKAFDVNRRNKHSLTPLHVAAANHSTNTCTTTITQLLVKNGAQILQNNDGKTPLHLAAENSCESVYIKALLHCPDPNTYINLTDLTDGNTALHICCKANISHREQAEVIKQLITSGASHNIRNHTEKKLALSLVHPSRKEEIKNLLNGK